MSKIVGCYSQEGRASLKHLDNNAVLETDIPAAHGGEGKEFSPGDMLVGALGACSLLTMGTMAKTQGKSLLGTQVAMDYETASRPSRIIRIVLTYTFPESLAPEDRRKFLAAIKACPVHNSLSKEIVVEVASN